MYMKDYQAPTSLGISERWERVLSYSLLWVSGIFFLLFEHRNQTVRHHAAQSVMIFGALSLLGLALGIVGFVFGWIPLLGPLVLWIIGAGRGLIWAVTITLWLVMMVLAFLSPKLIFAGARSERYI